VSGTPKKNSTRKTKATQGEASATYEGRSVYHISVVAELVETHPQTLRMYERMGLVSPLRTRNNVRLYTEEDIERVRRIQHLTQELGVNLAGVEVVFKLLNELERVHAESEALLDTIQRSNVEGWSRAELRRHAQTVVSLSSDPAMVADMAAIVPLRIPLRAASSKNARDVVYDSHPNSNDVEQSSTKARARHQVE
jgi:MerR family transcriptional regulator/heat shock protein HspR